MLEVIVVVLCAATIVALGFVVTLSILDRIYPRQQPPTPEEIEAMRKRRAEEALAPFWIKPGEKTIDDEG